MDTLRLSVSEARALASMLAELADVADQWR
jgi:hypothetical protein